MTDLPYDILIGLEVHVQLKTNTKLFCGCSTKFGLPPNSATCPVCIGMPGVLPVMNRRAFDFALLTGVALGCRINTFTKWDRKQYYYPDLPKNYQISQYDLPFAGKGFLEVELPGGGKKKIAIERVHLEEDAGKNVHMANTTGVDLNRTGTPLCEIVTDHTRAGMTIDNVDEAYAYLTHLKQILLYLEVSDCEMQEGSLRVDANISVRPKGSDKLGTKTEVKNMNSFRNVQTALTYEADRQWKLIQSGEGVKQATCAFDPDRGTTRVVRFKETASDYRYFPEPDLVPVVIQQATLDIIKSHIPELPAQRKERFLRDFSLSTYDVEVLLSSKSMADYFEKTAQLVGDPKLTANWITQELSKELNERKLDLATSTVTPEKLAELIGLVKNKKITGPVAKETLAKMFETGKKASELTAGLEVLDDDTELLRIAREAIAASGKAVEDYKKGKASALKSILGQAMRLSKGKANPQKIQVLIEAELAK